MEGKETVMIYRDWKEPVEQLTDEQAGILFKQLLQYVNDENPKNPSDKLVLVVWTMFRQVLKRDLVKWKNRVVINRENGKKGGRPRKTEKPKKADKDKDKDIKEKDKKEKTDAVSKEESIMKSLDEYFSLVMGGNYQISVDRWFMQYKLNRKSFEGLFEQFKTVCLDQGKLHRSPDDMHKHFANFIRSMKSKGKVVPQKPKLGKFGING